MGDFSRVQVEDLLGQHTVETGQGFAPGAVRAVWEQTRGQLWLVKALATEMCFSAGVPRESGQSLSRRDVFEARETLILRRDTHLDQLADELREPRVRRLIEPLLGGGDAGYSDCDFEYVRDLGLVAPGRTLRVANPIYGEVLPRALTWVLQQEIAPRETAWYVRPDGGLDLASLLAAFQDFVPAELRALDPACPVHRGRSAAGAPGVSAPRRERQGPNREGIRVGEPPGGSADRLAAGRGRGGPDRGRMQTRKGGPLVLANGRGRTRRDEAVHGHQWNRCRPSRRLRHASGQKLGGEDLPGGARPSGCPDHRLGGLTD